MSVKIAYLIGHLQAGGTQKHLVEVLKRLDRSRFMPQVYCLKRYGTLVPDIERLEVEVHDLGIGGSLSAPRSVQRLWAFARHLRATGTALVHSYNPRANLVATVAARVARAPAVLVSKRSLEPRGGLTWLLTCRLADAWADAVLVNSHSVRQHAVEVERCRAEKLRLVMNGIDLERFISPAPNGSHPPDMVVGSVLRLEAIKGPDTFLKAASQVAAQIPEARFILVGGGTLRAQLERDSVALGLGQRVQFLGERHDVPELLPTFSVFVLPSVSEGMSMALLEAMAAARPIVATRVGGNADLIRDGETGLLVASGNPDEMARAVQRLLQEPDTAAQLGQAARAVVLRDHSADGMVRRLEAIYDELLDKRRNVRGSYG